MDRKVAFVGRESIKKVVVSTDEVITTKAVPFVGVDNEGEFAQLGVGVEFPELGKAYLWGLVIPHRLIQSWRGMNILEQTTVINPSNTLAACWYAADSGNLQKDYVVHLSDAGIPWLKLQVLRALVHKEQPSSILLAEAITRLSEIGVTVDEAEV